MSNQTQQNLYELFGVADYVQKLQKEGKKEELVKLEDALSKFILMKGVEDLSENSRQKLASQPMKDGKDLYLFFSEHLKNFPAKLKSYGDAFRNTIIK